ncbi:uncharacterized protein G2W53_003421 [Senna tora]|uniref:Uncharacterized protein n=1 Tax=Senna tora TaxID=362788 RepID=A0A834XDG6_9FABA|nr:uncharacterized protein G2W53_003421 [Senna tora]
MTHHRRCLSLDVERQERSTEEAVAASIVASTSFHRDHHCLAFLSSPPRYALAALSGLMKYAQFG